MRRVSPTSTVVALTASLVAQHVWAAQPVCLEYEWGFEESGDYTTFRDDQGASSTYRIGLITTNLVTLTQSFTMEVVDRGVRHFYERTRVGNLYYKGFDYTYLEPFDRSIRYVPYIVVQVAELCAGGLRTSGGFFDEVASFQGGPDILIESGTYTETHEGIGWETVAVPFGTFRAFGEEIRTHRTFDDGTPAPIDQSLTLWSVPGLGMIKVANGNGYISELVDTDREAVPEPAFVASQLAAVVATALARYRPQAALRA